MVDKILASRGRKRFRKKRTRKKVGGKPKYGTGNGICPTPDLVLKNKNDRMYPVLKFKLQQGNKKIKLMDCGTMDTKCADRRRGAQGTKSQGIMNSISNCDGGQQWYDYNYNEYKKTKNKKYALRLKTFYEAMKKEEWFKKYDSWWRSTLADGHQKKPSDSYIGKFGRKVTKDVEDGFNPGASDEEQRKWKYEEHFSKDYSFPSSVKATYTVNKNKEVKANYLDDYVEMMREQKFTVTVKVPKLVQSGGESSLFAALKAAKNKIKNKIKEKKNALMATTTTTAAEETNVSTPKIVVESESMELIGKTIVEHYEEILKKVKPMFKLPKGIYGEEWFDEGGGEEKKKKMMKIKGDLLKEMGEIFRDKFEIIVEEKPKGGGKVRKSKKRKSRRKKRKETRRKSRRRRRR